MAQKKPNKKTSSSQLGAWLTALIQSKEFKSSLNKVAKNKKTSTSVAVMVSLLLVAINYWPDATPSSSTSTTTNSASKAAKGPYQLQGTVSHVADGDTINLQVDGQRERIRLANIDAPESGGRADRPGQPYADQSQKALAALVLDKTITVDCFEQDHYGRNICDIPMSDGKTVNQYLVEQGMAWAYTGSGGRYLRDKSLVAVQEQATKAKRGLWKDKKPVAPWVWRVECWQKKQCN